MCTKEMCKLRRVQMFLKIELCFLDKMLPLPKSKTSRKKDRKRIRERERDERDFNVDSNPGLMTSRLKIKSHLGHAADAPLIGLNAPLKNSLALDICGALSTFSHRALQKNMALP